MRKLLICLFAFANMAALAGCTESTSPTTSATNSASAFGSNSNDGSKENGGVPSAGSEIKVALANHAQLMEKIKLHKGKVVVVDVWSTSCVPCMKEFPHLVELARRWPEEVVCISINVDYIGLPNKPVESYEAKVTEFLKGVAADPSNMENLLGTEPDADILSKLDIEAMPGILIFDRAGDLSAKLTTSNAGDDGLSYAGDVIPLVEQLTKR